MLHISGTIHHMIVIFGNIFWVVLGVKGQKMVQSDRKFCLSCSISWEPCIIWLSFMVHIFKMINISRCFFHFFSKFWFPGSIGGAGKRAKHSPKNCLVRSCQESYIIWLSFMVHMCKMIISSGIFFIFFLNLIFSERAKNGLKWQKCLSIAPYISRTIYHMIFIYGTQI